MLKTERAPDIDEDCASFKAGRGVIKPEYCDRSILREVVCTTSAEEDRRKRQAERPGYSKKTRKKREAGGPKFDLFLNPEKRAKQRALTKKVQKKYRKAFNQMNLTASYPSIFQLLWHSINPCFDIKGWTSEYKDQKSTIKRCFWKGLEVSCSAIFKTNPTDRGMCCTFNARAAEEIYRDSMFSQSVNRLQEENIENAFDRGESPPGFDTGVEPRPEIGKNRGLTLIVDAHTNILSPSTVQDDFEGFLSVVSSRSKFPSIFEKVAFCQLSTPQYNNIIMVVHG